MRFLLSGRTGLLQALGAILLVTVCQSTVQAQETVSVVTPIYVTFNVDDVALTTVASPSTAAVSFSAANLDPGRHLSISVMANSPSFTAPSGGAIAASKVTWTISGSSGGNGFSGTLSDSAYSKVFESVTNPLSGSVDIVFRLNGPGSSIRAGDHDLSLRWQFTSEP